MKNLTISVIWVIGGGFSPLAAQPPGTDIYLATLYREGRALHLDSAVNLTRRPGYDNQPSFSPDGRSIYYTSGREGQTDIYRYDIAAQTTVQVTSTAESEYSPTVMPDGRHISVIRVERDSAQRLWQFGLDGKPDKPVLDTIKPVGYHAWLGKDTVFIFVLGTPATLRRADVARGTADILARDIGRTILRIPGSNAMSYVQRDSAGGWIRSIQPVNGAGMNLVRLPEGTEFYAWTPQGELLSAAGNRLLQWRAGQQGWAEVARFSEAGLQKISRIAVSPSGDRIALVSEEPAQPR